MMTSFQNVLLRFQRQNIFDRLLKQFYAGKPLTSNQLNLIRRFYYRLGPAFNPVLKYYEPIIKPPIVRNDALKFASLPESQIPLALRPLPQPLNSLPYNKLGHRIEYKLTPPQFDKFKQNLQDIHELIFIRGNQLLTGAPFYPGAIPHIDFFQWGNFFGVVKYQELLEEKALKGNILVYFEELANRNLQQCTKQYIQQLADQLIAKQNIITPPMPIPQLQPQPSYASPILHPVPRLILVPH
jgi:hypothetical protein